MSNGNTHRVVIRRKKVAGPGHHGGSWKIAYADFVTAMMAFFLVMWLVSIVSIEDRKGIAEYFRMPLKVSLNEGPNSSSSSSAIPGGGRDITETQGEVRRADISERTMQHDEVERRDTRRLEDLRKRLDQMIETRPTLRQVKQQLLIDITSEGLRIQIIDNQNRPMFATGRAEVEPYMRDLLRELAPLLNDLPNKVSISGHTDATQYSRGERSYSNWELSADRANASRRELVLGGMQEDKITRVVGMSSQMPLQKDSPTAAINRRISLVVLNRRTQQRIEAENAAAAASIPGSSAAQIGRTLSEQLAPVIVPSSLSGPLPDVVAPAADVAPVPASAP
jgi:chemotaxis protein MotB